VLLFLIHGSKPGKFLLRLSDAVSTIRVGIFIISLRGLILNDASVVLIFVLLRLLILSSLILFIIHKLESRFLIDLVTVLFLQFKDVFSGVALFYLSHRLIGR
jgi:hypothetical protein